MMLTDRLEKIAECIDCKTLADVGTDHGYIPIYAVKNGKCEKAIACDVNKGPLKSADENISSYGLSAKIETRLSDGLEGLGTGEADTIVIAGMGGFLIRDILERGADRLDDNTTLLLQPMVAVAELREYLVKNGYNIFNERLSREGEKFYNILCVRKGKCEYTERDILLGRNIEDDENYGDYVNFHRGVVEKIIDGLSKSTGKEDEIAELKRKLDIMK
ncbi:MAG: SAM-dependent methyltransferase [Clostridia bacterium]|nr:SAM-dependent methyltransferase [Clostridia bacterium]